ncbi:hypothetical protein KFK09_018356 [Dendrobium nobile]|uniref:Uncharacterized protein n=1 Tax=Dendrobium nobile TaxID=94219 RepID=A0A8T3AVK9_DENNO|nr:hypothetical protein KFK09_018356 [Dendrobium nobile]
MSKAFGLKFLMDSVMRLSKDVIYTFMLLVSKVYVDLYVFNIYSIYICVVIY